MIHFTIIVKLNMNRCNINKLIVLAVISESIKVMEGILS